MPRETSLAHGPRIERTTAREPEVQAILAKTLLKPDGEAINIFATLARNPRLLKRYNVLGGLFFAHTSLDERQRELVILRTSWQCASLYEWSQHVDIARRVGVHTEELSALTQDLSNGPWSPIDRVGLTLTDELLSSVDASDATWAAATKHWDEAQLLELCMLVGFYRMTAGVLNAAGVAPDAGLPDWP